MDAGVEGLINNGIEYSEEAAAFSAYSNFRAGHFHHIEPIDAGITFSVDPPGTDSCLVLLGCVVPGCP